MRPPHLLPVMMLGFAITGLLLSALECREPGQGMAVGTDGLMDPTLPPVGGTGFVENRGQLPAASLFVSRGPGFNAHFRQDGVVLQLLDKTEGGLRCDTVRIGLFDADPEVAVRGESLLETRLHQLRGPTKDWVRDIRCWSMIRYRSPWPGMDIVVHPDGKTLAYDLEIGADALIEAAVFVVEGARALRIDENGSLVVETTNGCLRQDPPIAWFQGTDGRREPVKARFNLLSEGRFGFEVDRRREDLLLVIDPGLHWSTFLGSSGYDYSTSIATAPDGGILVCGYTASVNFPTVPGSYDTTYNQNLDAWVCRLSADGKTLVWSTFLGGEGRDWATGLVVDAGGQVTVTGYTESSGFPTSSGAFQALYRNSGDGFVSRLSKDGRSLVWSTYLGGKDYDLPEDVAVDTKGRTAIVGWTKSGDFPTTTGAYDTTYSDKGDGFVTLLDATGKGAVFSTYLGGKGWDPLVRVRFAKDGDTIVTGESWISGTTNDYPVTSGAFQTLYGGGKSDAVVTRIKADGASLVWSTYLGGTDWDPIRGLALDQADGVVVVGETFSTDWPVSKDAIQAKNAGKGDACLARLSADGSKLVYGSYLGGSIEEDQAWDVAFDDLDRIVVAGWTESGDFPTTAGAFDTSYGGKGDGFITRIGGNPLVLQYSTLFGGTSWDPIHAMCFDTPDLVTFVGEAWWTDFPVSTSAYDTSYNQGGDGYAARIDLLPTGIARIGTSTPSCMGPILLGPDRDPIQGESAFGISSVHGPGNSAGIFLISGKANPVPLTLLGINVHVDILSLFLTLPAPSDPRGNTLLPLPLPQGTKGIGFGIQCVWLNTATCGGVGTLSASDALSVTIQ